MDITTEDARKVTFGATPTTLADAYRWMEHAIAWHGYRFEGDDANGDPLTLVTGFHWDTRGEDIRSSRGQRLSRQRQRMYDVNAEAAFTIIDQSWQSPGGAYAAAEDVQPCHDCRRFVMWRDDTGWVHIDSAAPHCFLHGSFLDPFAFPRW